MTIQDKGRNLRNQNPNLYINIHRWLVRNYKKNYQCLFCGKKGNTNYALKKDKLHDKNIKNYYELCVSCHRKYDCTDEMRRKMSITRKGKLAPWRNKKIKDEFGNIFSSITNASKLLKISRTAIHNCLSGKTKMAGKIAFKYI